MFIALVELCELAGIAGLLHLKKQDETSTALMLKSRRPRTLPIVDGLVRPFVGSPTKLQRVTAKRGAALIRFAVNTQAFDMLLLMLANPKSKLRARGSKLREIGITL